MAVASQSFPQFPRLPKELRDAVWRLCLPHRVVELDYPDPEWFFDIKYQYDVDRDIDMKRPADGSFYACQMRHTTNVNSRPPIISRVCREARSVALESAQLHSFLPQPAQTLIPRAWVDRARDNLCLHFFPNMLDLFWTEALDELHRIKRMTRVDTVAVCNELVEAHEGYVRGDVEDIPQRLQQYGLSYLVCTDVFVIHAHELDAIHAGIFGRLGEERVVLVDALDTTRLLQYKDFAQAHATMQDRATQTFFEPHLSGWPLVRFAETPEEYMQELETRWLLYSQNRHERSDDKDQNLLSGNWLTTPESFEDSDDDPRYVDYGALPGRPFARQLWKPNRDHPWVQETLLRMPKFTPVIMFRLCTKNCWLDPEGTARRRGLLQTF